MRQGPHSSPRQDPPADPTHCSLSHTAATVKQDQVLTPQERARITEIQDLLIDRFVQHREATEKGQRWRAKELEAEIEELQNEKGNVAKWAAVGSA